jgi:hypothetical protein
MKTFVGLLMVALMLGGVFYQLVSGKVLSRNWRPFTSRAERPVLYWMAISIETAGALAVLYGVFRDAILHH